VDSNHVAKRNTIYEIIFLADPIPIIQSRTLPFDEWKTAGIEQEENVGKLSQILKNMHNPHTW